MRIIEADKHAVDIPAITTAPSESHYKQVLKAPCAVRIDGRTELIALPAGDSSYELLAALRRIKYAKTARTNGLITHSRTFGYSPRVAVRSDFCCAAKLVHESPDINAILEKWGRKGDTAIQEHLPEQYAAQTELLKGVLPYWRMNDTNFTSGIANKNNALGYHRDSGNFKGAWSVMFAFQRGIEGGLLSIPELDIALDFDQPTMLLFDGARLLHGVSPIRLKTKHSYRYTVVFYALSGMAHCGTPAEELNRIREVKTERERARQNADEAKRRIKG